MKRRELTEFGVTVKKRLVELGQTQKELAEAVGMGDVYLNVILHGKRSGRKYIKSIVDYLQLEMPTDNQTKDAAFQKPKDNRFARD